MNISAMASRMPALSRITAAATARLTGRAASSSFPPPPCRAAVQPPTFADRRRGLRRYSASSPSPASVAQLVKQLRASTGAPMMECKKALSSPEVDGDVDKAREWLRKHGSAKATSKVAGREAPEGLVGIKIAETGEGTTAGSLAKVASETDFASRSEVFSDFVQEVADAAAAAGKAGAVEDVAGFLSSATNGEGKPLSERLNDAILAIRENLQVDSVSVLETSSPDSILAGYVHGRASPGATCGTAASLVELEITSDEGKDAAKEAGKKLAMHVVAAKPLYLNPESVPDDVVQKEKEILMEKMANTNKPPEILEKIIAGQLRKFYEGICLTEQAHMVEEGNPKVSKVLKESGLEVRAFLLNGMKKS
ncbi:hypothetical protein ACHAWF_001316 [Thalassiosira exigua]